MANLKKQATNFQNELGELKSLANNHNFLKLVLTFSMIQGFSTVLDGMLKPYNYSSMVSALVGVFFLLPGLISAMIFSAYVDRT